jgi:hypothetical protein
MKAFFNKNILNYYRVRSKRCNATAAQHKRPTVLKMP